MSGEWKPTLESIEQLQDVRNLRGYELGAMIRAMQKTGFQTWGFVIYRGTYSNDAAWQRYVDLLKNEIQTKLEYYGRAELLLQYLQWTIIEDPALEGLSKAAIRQTFQEWVLHRSVGRDGTGADYPGLMLDSDCIIPRFSHCIYVDKGCLNTLFRYETWQKEGSKGLAPLVACALIDVNCDAAGLGRKGYPDIEQCSRAYVGWMYLSLKSIPPMYNSQSLESSHGYHEYDPSYIRPPLIYPYTGQIKREGGTVLI